MSRRRLPWLRLIVIVLALLGAGLPAVAKSAKSAKDHGSAAPDEPGIKYSVEITGAPGSGVHNLMKGTSQLEELRKKHPATMAALARRVKTDEDRFRAILESQGYYGGKVSSTTEPRGDSVHVHVVIEPGPRYTVSQLAFDYGDRAPQIEALNPKARPESILQSIVGKPAIASEVIQNEENALELLRKSGFPFAQRGDRQVTVDHAANTIAVLLPVHVGRRARFGETYFSGEQRLKPTYLQRLVPWKTGTTFDTSQLDRFRQNLVRTTLFSSVRIKPAPDQEAPDGAPLDVLVNVTEGPRRSIQTDAKYGRDTGFGGTVTWENRNLFGNAEKLDLSADATQILQTVKADLTKPNWKRLDQTLLFTSILQRSDTAAVNGVSATLTAGVQRRIAEHWTVGIGASAEIARLIENGVPRRSLLGGLPLTANHYVTDDITETAVVDATKGWRLALAITPYGGTYRQHVFFVRSEVEVDGYLPANASRSIVMAGRLKLGSIAGSATENIPSNRRFYAGGGGSIRGYGYQLVSPLDQNGTPVGGRSLIETSLEARLRVTRTIGIVPFVDAGSVSTSTIPGQNVSMRVAGGLGLRYYTPVGPLRVDFAVPINKRPVIDKGFQFYISFGQAF